MYTNNFDIDLAPAVWLATDNYDHEPGVISATSFTKPLREVILSSRIPKELKTFPDIAGLIKSRTGTAIHDSAEFAWKDNYQVAMKALGYSEKQISNFEIITNLKSEPTPGKIPIYLENRHYKEVAGHTVSGKYDIVIGGRVEDYKSTGTFKYNKTAKIRDYIIQGSIYRFLAPEIITEDIAVFHEIYLDWSIARADSNNYPLSPVNSIKVPLWSLAETEEFITTRLNSLSRLKNAPEERIPLCNEEDLQPDSPSWKYYKNPNKTARASRVFDNSPEAFAKLAADGNVGTVIKVDGEVWKCKYCSAFQACSQKDLLIQQGRLKV